MRSQRASVRRIAGDSDSLGRRQWRWFGAALTASIVLIWGSANALAQPYQQQHKNDCKESGTVDGFSGNVLQMKTANNQLWLVAVQPQCKIQVDGTAEPSFLHTGLFVEFSGTIDEKGNLQEDVGDMTVVTPQGKAAGGIFEEGADANAKPVKKLSAGKYDIRGKVSSFKDGHLMVVAGGKKVTGKVGDDATIKVSVADLGLAQAGSTVEVSGWCYDQDKPWQNKPGKLTADQINITLSEALSSAKKAKPTKPAPRTTKGGKVTAKDPEENPLSGDADEKPAKGTKKKPK